LPWAVLTAVADVILCEYGKLYLGKRLLEYMYDKRVEVIEVISEY
jgi:hypothetical protein